MIELAREFGHLPDDVADRMSEEWYWRSLAYLPARAQSKRKSGPRPLVEPDPDELDRQGRWFLTG